MSEENVIVDIGDDFIGVFDNACPAKLCDELRSYFDIYHADGYTYDRAFSNNEKDRLKIDDVALSMTGMNLVYEINIRGVGKLFNNYFWANCYAPYASKFTALNHTDPHKVINYKLQRTLPMQGYHIWHYESMVREASDRILAFTLYLNDVEEGGETEFLYQKRRVKPKKSRCVIWPSGLTHIHRGNPPLSGDKYILTGWVQF